LEFEKLLALNPRHAQGNYRLGLIHYEKKAYEKSEMYMKMAVQYDAGITDAHYHLGMIYFIGNKLADSKKSFLTAVSQAPQHPDANYHLGLINFEQKLYPDSRKHFAVVVNMPEYAVDTNYHLGVMDYLDKKYAQSEAEFKKVVQAESKHKMAHFYLGRLYYDTKAWLKSRDSYMKALAVEPDQPMFKYNLALTYIKLPHYFEARDNLKEVLKKEPTNTLAKAELLDLERIIADSVAGTGKGALATKRTIAVGNFTSNAKVTDYKWLEVGIAESLTTDLSGLSGVTLVERGNLEKVMREKKLEAVGMTTESVSSVGREVGAEAIIIGGYQVAGPKGEEELRVDGRLVSVQDGSILKSESSRGKIGDLYNMERTLALALLADYVFISATEQDAFLKGKASDLNALENWSKGKSLALLGNSDAAAAYYKKALETDPQYSAALRDLKLSQKDLGKTDTLAIMAFKNATGKADYEWLSMGIAESLTTDLKKLTGIYLVERLEIEKALREMKLAEAGLVDETKAPQLGKMVGAGIVAVGSYQVFGTKIRIDMRMVEVETSQILLTEKIDGEMDKIFEAEEKLAMKIAQTLNRSLSPEEVAKLKDKPDLESFKKYIMAQASLTLAEQKQEGGTKVKAVAITPFENASGNKEYDWLKEGIPGSLTTDLKSMGKLSLIERAQVDKALSEMKLTKAGLVDEKIAPKLGRATGADTVISGSYQISGENIRIDARLVRVGSGEVLRASNASGELKDVFNVEKTLAYKLLDAMGVDVAAGAGEKGEARSLPSATVSSIIVPGAGQILVNKQATKGFIMIGVEGALAVGAIAMMSDASAKNDKYVQSGGTDDTAYNSSTQSYNTGVMLIGGMAALAVYSGVDAWYVARTYNMKLGVGAPVPAKAE
jgi:TolB-like protein/Tfp pilus assembly protein PilF